jgi:hypothetical protein
MFTGMEKKGGMLLCFFDGGIVAFADARLHSSEVM